jgi:hypothetical protein
MYISVKIKKTICFFYLNEKLLLKMGNDRKQCNKKSSVEIMPMFASLNRYYSKLVFKDKLNKLSKKFK